MQRGETGETGREGERAGGRKEEEGGVEGREELKRRGEKKSVLVDEMGRGVLVDLERRI